MFVPIIILVVAVIMVCSGSKCKCPQEEVIYPEGNVPTYFG